MPLLLLAWLTACAAAEEAAPAGATLCVADERVQFSCRVGARTVSLCAAGAGRIDALTYRYGLPGRIELAFSARTDNTLRFQGTVMPAAPRAQVRQVWFDRGDLRYLLSQCVGGSCPHAAGLAVLKGDQVLMNRRCDRPAQRGHDMFNVELVQFGSDVDGSQSNTPLLELGEYDNLLEQLYKVSGDAGR